MDELTGDLNTKLTTPGEVTLTDDQRLAVVRAIEMLGSAQRQIALQARLLESHGHDEARILELLDAGAPDDFAASGIDLIAHERARADLADRLDAAASAGDWIGAVLDFVRVVAL